MSTPNQLLDDIAGVGADPARGGYSRHVFDHAEQELREWFVARAEAAGLRVEVDRNANIWAWWGEPGPDALVTGSHLDSVPGGGAYDGPLGVVSALVAIESLRSAGFRPSRPVAVVVFAEEEGGRFGVPCLGSRLLAGTIDPDKARGLRDQDGVSYAEAMRAARLDPAHIGKDTAALDHIGQFVELHVEQGRGLIDLGSPVAVASSILGHGRWRFRFTGQGNHAGATLIADRHDPMLPAAEFIARARAVAREHDGRATVGRLVPNPGGTNVIASTVDLWLDARAELDATTRSMVDQLRGHAEEFAAAEGCGVELFEESYADTVHFEPVLRDELAGLLDAPALPTGAGHDAGVLAAVKPTAMVFVRNPTGISHAPEEFAEEADCTAGAEALARVLRRLSQ